MKLIAALTNTTLPCSPTNHRRFRFDKPGRDKKATNLEEVFTQARAEDDYGVVSMDLHFSVNGGEEKKVNLQQLTRESARSLTGAYTFFLEEYKLIPGDFISYYAKARDANNETTSDIYFIEVKPFEMEYRAVAAARRAGAARVVTRNRMLSRDGKRSDRCHSPADSRGR